MSKKRAMMLGLDGADPVRVKKLIAEGRLPNMKRVLEMGAAAQDLDMLGVFPTVTPPNWTTLATGNYPRTHGITCYLNHTIGKDLGITELNWDSRRIESELIWEAFEDEGKKCIALNYCQAWPNRVENSNNIFVDGTGVVPFLRCSADFQKIIHLDVNEDKIREIPHYVDQKSGDCIVYGDQIEKFGKASSDMILSAKGNHFRTPSLETQAVVMKGMNVEEDANSDAVDLIFSPIKEPRGWTNGLSENAKEATIILNQGLARRFAVLTASNGVDYDTISIYANKKDEAPLGSAKVGEWSDWIYDNYNMDNEKGKVAYKIRVIQVAEDGTSAEFYLSHVIKLEDSAYYYPPEIHKGLMENVGPMLFFATIYRHSKIGDEIALESWEQLHDWHVRATQYLFETNPDWQLFYIHLHSIDLLNHWYINQAIQGSHPEWERIANNIDRIYEINDKYIGHMLEYLDENTTIFICSDHGATPRSPGYVNPGIGELSGINAGVLSELGYTKIFPASDQLGPGFEDFYLIDWTQTKAINHRTSHIYINLKGRDPQGIVEPEEYEALVQQIISDLYSYRDPKSGDRVVSFAMTREEMECIGMGGPHCGDIFFQLRPDFQFEHANCPNHVTNHGYSVGCLCIMAGSGIKQGYTVNRKIRNVDIVPTICHVVGNRMPKDVEGGVIWQALKE